MVACRQSASGTRASISMGTSFLWEIRYSYL